MWIQNKTAEEQELINQAMAKILKNSSKRVSEGLTVTVALKNFLKNE